MSVFIPYPSYSRLTTPNHILTKRVHYIMRRFHVDCSAAVSLYSSAEGAFGVSGSLGEEVLQCPAPSLSPGCGVPSNCWSPGQRDTDCPNNGLCCFDGCADTCVDGPKPAPTPAPTPAPLPVEPVVAEEESAPEAVTEGYVYPVPDIPLELPKPSPPPPGLPTLYGPPEI